MHNGVLQRVVIDRVNCHHRSGLSLIDMTVAVLIVGIMSVVAVPRYTAMLQEYRVEAAAKRLAVDLRSVQEDAKANSQSRSITFNALQASYDIATSSALDLNGHVDLSSSPYHVSHMEVVLSEAQDGSSANQITFNAYGRANRGYVIQLKVGEAIRYVVSESNGFDVSISQN